MGTPLRACVVAAFLFLLSPGVSAQGGAASARLTGQVSAAVAVSASEAHGLSGGAHVSIVKVNATTVAVTISGSGSDEARVSLPLQLRSNVGYGLRASILSADALSVRLAVAGVRATGKFVHANALEALRLDETVASTGGEGAALLKAGNQPLPVALLSGSSISKAGTFSSPDNAIEAVLSISIKPQACLEAWSTRLTISAAPDFTTPAAPLRQSL